MIIILRISRSYDNDDDDTKNDDNYNDDIRNDLYDETDETKDDDNDEYPVLDILPSHSRSTHCGTEETQRRRLRKGSCGSSDLY